MPFEAARRYVERFVNLSDNEFEFLTHLLEVRHFDKKQILIREGEVEQFLNFIVEGLARKFFYRNAEEIVTQIGKEGDLICCYDSFLSGIPSNYAVETIEPTVVLSITMQRAEEFYRMGAKMERLGRLIVTEQFLNKEYWEYDRMRLDSHERFIRFVEGNPDLLRRVPQKYLASYLNIKPETFSRLKHLLIKKV